VRGERGRLARAGRIVDRDPIQEPDAAAAGVRVRRHAGGVQVGQPGRRAAALRGVGRGACARPPAPGRTSLGGGSRMNEKTLKVVIGAVGALIVLYAVTAMTGRRSGPAIDGDGRALVAALDAAGEPGAELIRIVGPADS